MVSMRQVIDGFEFGDNDNGPLSWNGLTKKPSKFPPMEHRHHVNDIDGLSSSGGGGVSSWDDLTDKPSTFPPDSHGHSINDIESLQNALNSKAPVDHSHDYAPTGHSHNYATTQQGALADTAVQPEDLSTVATTGTYADLEGLPQIPSSPGDVGAAPASHTHTIANVTGLQSAIDGKAPSSHSHSVSDVTGLDAALSGKAEAVIVTTGSESRPDADTVLWIGGTTQPINALNNVDIWFEAGA